MKVDKVAVAATAILATQVVALPLAAGNELLKKSDVPEPVVPKYVAVAARDAEPKAEAEVEALPDVNIRREPEHETPKKREDCPTEDCGGESYCTVM